MGGDQCVGAVIRQNDGGEEKYLTEYRLAGHEGLAFLQAHIVEGESPEDALYRALLERAGLYPVRSKLLPKTFIGGDCPEFKGEHEWSIYEVVADGKLLQKGRNKQKFVDYLSIRQMGPYMKHHEVDPTWFYQILPALRIL